MQILFLIPSPYLCLIQIQVLILSTSAEAFFVLLASDFLFFPALAGHLFWAFPFLRQLSALSSDGSLGQWFSELSPPLWGPWVTWITLESWDLALAKWLSLTGWWKAHSKRAEPAQQMVLGKMTLWGPLSPFCEKMQSPQVRKITYSHSWPETIGAKTPCG